MKLSASRTLFCLVAVGLCVGVFGGVMGSQAQTAQKAGEEDISTKLFTSLIGMVEENYATEVDSDKALYGAIDGMLRTLDPHSKFFDPKAFNLLREDQRGKYFGLGITVAARFGKVTVVSPPFPDSPAEKVGLRVGDMITHVNGDSTQGLDLNDVVSRLKGPRGTPVQVTIVRPGLDEPMQLTVIRGEISKFTINNAFVIKPGIGYIKLDSFAETSGDELQAALRKIDYKRLDGLIFDLRNNPGGLLTEAIEISEVFLQKGQTILQTKGRTRGSDRPYVANAVNRDAPYPVVILINQQSASASEIVAGALQDHDRALIVGQTSFGKGLVQSVYELSKKSGLALTTQKWYTPSGRLIQRDYSHISQFDYYNHRDNPQEQQKTDIKHTDLGRIVYGGGGITPDYVIDEPKLNEFQISLGAPRYAVFSFVQDYLAKNPPIAVSFQVSDALLNEFKQYIVKRGVQFTDADFESNKDFMRLEIRREVFYNRLGTADATRITLEADPLILKAISLLPEAKDLLTKSPRRIAGQR